MLLFFVPGDSPEIDPAVVFEGSTIADAVSQFFRYLADDCGIGDQTEYLGPAAVTIARLIEKLDEGCDIAGDHHWDFSAPDSAYHLIGAIGPSGFDTLVAITTRDEQGRHFSSRFDNWEELEAARLIEVDRPTHPCGIPSTTGEWSVSLTKIGETVLAMYAEHRAKVSA